MSITSLSFATAAALCLSTQPLIVVCRFDDDCLPAAHSSARRFLVTMPVCL